MLVPPRWTLILLAVLVLGLWLVIGRGSVFFSLALLGLCIATGAYILAVYAQVRRERKARDKARILRRVADLEGKARPTGPTPRF